MGKMFLMMPFSGVAVQFILSMTFSGVAVSGFARTVETSRRARTGFARSAGKTSKTHTFVIVGVLIEIHTEYDLKHTFESANSG